GSSTTLDEWLCHFSGGKISSPECSGVAADAQATAASRIARYRMGPVYRWPERQSLAKAPVGEKLLAHQEAKPIPRVHLNELVLDKAQQSAARGITRRQPEWHEVIDIEHAGTRAFEHAPLDTLAFAVQVGLP